MNINGYETKTTFWSDFSIAEKFGLAAILDTYKRAFRGWRHNVEYLTELVMILNWKCWYFYENGNEALAKYYGNLYYQAHDWCQDNLKGDDLAYYYRTTD